MQALCLLSDSQQLLLHTHMVQQQPNSLDCTRLHAHAPSTAQHPHQYAVAANPNLPGCLTIDLLLLLQMEELMMMPLQPYGPSGVDPAARRWVRHDFKMRRKLFLEEVAKVAVEGPIHKIEVRRSRCFKDSVATFSGKVRREGGLGGQGWVVQSPMCGGRMGERAAS
jgi:hypothetical protein